MVISFSMYFSCCFTSCFIRKTMLQVSLLLNMFKLAVTHFASICRFTVHSTTNFMYSTNEEIARAVTR